MTTSDEWWVMSDGDGPSDGWWVLRMRIHVMLHFKLGPGRSPNFQSITTSDLQQTNVQAQYRRVDPFDSIILLPTLMSCCCVLLQVSGGLMQREGKAKQRTASFAAVLPVLPPKRATNKPQRIPQNQWRLIFQSNVIVTVTVTPLKLVEILALKFWSNVYFLALCFYA